MMIIYIVLGSSLLLLVILFCLYKHFSEKYKLLLIKTDTAKSNIELLLNDKLGLLEEIGKELNDIDNGKISQTVGKVKNKRLSNIQLNDELFKIYNDLNVFLLEKKDFVPNEELEKLLNNAHENEIELEATKGYFNENIERINVMAHSFPSNIVAKITKVKSEETYSMPKLEFFEILKEK